MNGQDQYWNPYAQQRRRQPYGQPYGAQYYPGGQQVQRTQPLRGGGEQVTSYYQQGPPAPRQAGFAGLTRRAQAINPYAAQQEGAFINPFRLQQEAQRMEQLFPGYSQMAPSSREAAMNLMPQMEQGMIQRQLQQYLSPEQAQYEMEQQFPENPWFKRRPQLMQRPQAGFGAPQTGRSPYTNWGYGGTAVPNWQGY